MSEYIYATNGKVMGDEDGLISLPREEVVRCRDCKWFGLDQGDHDFHERYKCSFWHTDLAWPDGFCAWGERRD